VEQFVDEDPKSPNIGLGAIDIMDQSLRTHIEWTPYRYISKVGGGFNGETEVPNLVVTLRQ